MGLFHRRWPRYVRPLPFLTLGPVGLVLVWFGLNFTLNFSRQTGNFFLLVSIPTTLLTFEGGKIFLFLLGLAGLVGAFAWGSRGERALRRRAARRRLGVLPPRFRFYPLTMLLGLFVLYFGLVFLFDASVTADNAPGGFVAFIYLNYAGLLDRPFVTAVGLSLIALGTWAASFGAFAGGLGAAGNPPMPKMPPPAPPTFPPTPTRPFAASPRPPARFVPSPEAHPGQARSVTRRPPVAARAPVRVARPAPARPAKPT